jgi:hypothetical protein
MGTPDDPHEYTITFRVLDLELAEIDNPGDLSFHVEVVL